MTPAARRRALEAVVRSVEWSATLFEQGGYPPNPAKAMPESAARCRARAAEMRDRLDAWDGEVE